MSDETNPKIDIYVSSLTKFILKIIWKIILID